MVKITKKRFVWKKCKDCGKRFRAKSNRVRFCSSCRKEHRKASLRKSNRKASLNRTHQKLLDDLNNKRFAYLETRINYNPNKDYFEHNDERYGEHIGDDYNDIYSQKHDDESWLQYHYKLQNLKKNLGSKPRY